MANSGFKLNFNITDLDTPCYIVDENLLKKNLEILDSVQKESGAEILLALKGFSMYSVFPLIKQYLNGISASSVNEARLGYEEFGKQVHTYSPGYSEKTIDDIINYSDYIIFNSFAQLERFKFKILQSEKNIEIGIRINPEYSEVKTPLYNPCYKFSRLGITLTELEKNQWNPYITGLHFHCMCEQNSDTLERVFEKVEQNFSEYFNKIKWINLGGGHHITRTDYDINKLIDLLIYIKTKYNLKVFMEPGEAIVLNTGFFVSEVLDIIKNQVNIVILDCSAATHLPDILEMPYRPEIIGAGEPGELKHTYRLGGLSCLAGDVIGDYSFNQELKIGDKLVFTDMGHYTMVKTTTFNGVNLPNIYKFSLDNKIELVKNFGYQDYKSRI